MPQAVRDEINALGDPEIAGWGPTLKHWLRTSQHPRLIKWREDLCRIVQAEYRAAERRQIRTNDAAREFYGDSNARHVAVLDPFFRDMNEDCFRGKEKIEQERKDSPKIFIK